MRTRIFGVTALVAALLLVPGGAGGATTHRFTLHFEGAQISATKSVYAVSGSLTGAAVQTSKLDPTGTAGSERDVVYTGRGTSVGAGTFKLSAPDAQGIVTITGKGHFVRGTGIYKGITGRYTFTGTFDTKTTHTHVMVKGSSRY